MSKIVYAGIILAMAMAYKISPDVGGIYFWGGTVSGGFFFASIFFATRNFLQEIRARNSRMSGMPRCRTRHISWHDWFGSILVLIVLFVAFFYPWLKRFFLHS